MISLDVNTVRTDTIIYRYKKSFFLFDFALDNVFAAKYEKILLRQDTPKVSSWI